MRSNKRDGLTVAGGVAVLGLIAAFLFPPPPEALADTKISAMPQAAPLAGSELIPVVQSGRNVSTTPNQIKTFVSLSAVSSVGSGCGLTGGPITSSGTLSENEQINSQVGTTYSLLSSDCGKMLVQSNAASSAWTLLAPGSAGSGYVFDVTNIGAGALTLTPTSGNINGQANLTLTTSQGAHVSTDGANYFAVLGGSGGGGGGSVTSVGLSVPAEFSVTGSPVVSTGTLTVTKALQSPNRVYAGPTTGGAAQPTFRSLVGADLPVPGATTLGGVESLAATTHRFLTSISTSGVPSAAQPLCGDLSDAGTACNAATGASGHVVPFLDGSNTFSGSNYFNGHVRVARRTASGVIAVSNTTDYELCADTSVGAPTVNLYTGPNDGDQIVVKDCRRNAAVNNITINAGSGTTVEGSAALVISANSSAISFTFNGPLNNWDAH